MESMDYHDYVIQDGKFIGAFEEMYRNCPDPWHQDEVQPLAEGIALLLLSAGRYERILDIGCGKGRFTNRIREATSAVVSGLDLAPSALKTARARCPEIDFREAAVPPLPFPDESFDLVVSAELLWYVLPELPRLFEEVRRVLEPGGHYLVIQQFYLPDRQSYGNEVMQAPEDLISLLPFPVRHCVKLDRESNPKLIALCELSD